MESLLAMKKFLAAGIGLMGCGCIWLLMGCAEVVVPGAMAGSGEYYRYTTSNVAKETLMGDVRDVTAAARSALNKMDFLLHSVTPYTDETVIFASTSELDITINIVPISTSTTKVIVAGGGSDGAETGALGNIGSGGAEGDLPQPWHRRHVETAGDRGLSLVR